MGEQNIRKVLGEEVMAGLKITFTVFARKG
jgi:hypothetical protein